jgi:hypothetical protein
VGSLGVSLSVAVGRASVTSMMLLIVCELDRDEVSARLPMVDILPSAEGVRSIVDASHCTHED